MLTAYRPRTNNEEPMFERMEEIRIEAIFYSTNVMNKVRFLRWLRFGRWGLGNEGLTRSMR